MKLIIAGSRTLTNPRYLLSALEVWPDLTACQEVVCGCARGIDSLGMLWACFNDKEIVKFPANWKELGKKAGYIRNEAMACYATQL